MESFKYGTTFDGIWGEQAVPGCGSVQAGTQMNSSLVLVKVGTILQKRFYDLWKGTTLYYWQWLHHINENALHCTILHCITLILILVLSWY